MFASPFSPNFRVEGYTFRTEIIASLLDSSQQSLSRLFIVSLKEFLNGERFPAQGVGDS